MKTLTIRDPVYEKLKALKREGESFSELFERLAVRENRSITEFAGFLSERKAKEVSDRIKEYRKATDPLDRAKERRLKKQWSY